MEKFNLQSIENAARLEEIMNQISGNELLLSPDWIKRDLASIEGATLIAQPSEITWSAPINVYETSNGQVTTDFDASAFKNEVTTRYYVSPTGDDSNTGLTESDPLLFLETAINKADADEVVMLDGVYTLREALLPSASGNDFIIDKDINVIAKNEDSVDLLFGRLATDLTYTKTSGQDYVYQRTFTTIGDFIAVFDLTYDKKFNMLKEFKEVSSLADCNYFEGSYYISGSVLYIHCKSDRAPDENIVTTFRVYSFNVISTSDFNVYFEGLNVYGSKEAIRVNADKVGNDSLFAAKNCRFLFNGYNAANTNDINEVVSIYGSKAYFQNCIAGKGNKRDGFSYFDSLVTDEGAKAIEVNCAGYDNGDGITNNGSTAHDGAQVITVQSAFWNNGGHNIADIRNCVRWVIGCISADSQTGVDVVAYTDSEIIVEKCWIPDISLLMEKTGETPNADPHGTITTIDNNTNITKVSSALYKYA